MRVELSAEYYELAASVGSYLDRAWSATDVRSYWDGAGVKQDEVWQGLARLGVFGLTVPAAHGGDGLPALSTALVLELAGRRCLPHPVAETVAVVTPALAAAGGPQAAAWLARIAAGQARATVQDGWSGYAPWGADSDIVLVIDGDDAVHLCGRAPADSRVASVDPCRRLARASRDQLIQTFSVPGLGAQARLRATVATSVTLGGVSLETIALGVAYAGVRTQFGQVIGAFQAVKHILADAYFAVETNRRFGWVALSAVDRGSPTMTESASVAKLTMSEAAQQASYAGLQVHGGIGYTWECDLHLWLKRIQVLVNWFGTPDDHARELAGLYRSGYQGGLTHA
jgi:alkylation response protein AidB-like acyl-CoA dehydrogenase